MASADGALDRTAGEPLYRQLMQRLIAEHGAYAPGGKAALSDCDLMARYGVSRPTVRSAVAELVRAGLVTRVPGRGTFFVPAATVAIGIDGLDRFVHEWQSPELDPGSVILTFERVRPPLAIGRTLDAGRDERVLLIRRLRTSGGEPASLDVRYVAPWCADHVTRAAAEHELLFKILAKHAVPASAVDQEIGAAIADGDTAERLGVPRGTALLTRDVTIFTTGDRPVITGTGWYRADRFRFRTRAER